MMWIFLWVTCNLSPILEHQTKLLSLAAVVQVHILPCFVANRKRRTQGLTGSFKSENEGRIYGISSNKKHPFLF